MRRVGKCAVILFALLPLIVMAASGMRPAAEKFLDWLDELDREVV
jgi:hypothetical protein